ncbi:MAG: hypothetical protein P4L33_18905 [Capsulimonadaceae bacterium]|nr:hypothetical protein [Capsulimonadaceae bacterium]
MKLACVVAMAIVVSTVHGPQAVGSSALEPSATDSLFPFDIPASNSSAGAVTNMSFLNNGPAGDRGRIVSRDGHFVESQTGRRVRFAGISLGGRDLFPTHELAEQTAAHLSEMGINLVRCHLQDLDDSPLWDKSTGAHIIINSAAFERLDYLIYQLKIRGIYVDLNLLSGRRFTPADGFPKSVDDLPGRFGRPVELFDSRMIDLQKQFACDYLTHVNPYTRLSYIQDPCVAMIEITNEDSLLSWHHDQAWLSLPEPFRGELACQWNAWLKRRYGTDTRLRKAWQPHFTPPAKSSLLANPGGPIWTLEDHTSAAALTATGDATLDGPPSIRIDTPVVPDAAWKVQAILGGLDLADGTPYVLSFRARADRDDRPLSIFACIDQPDWHIVGIIRHVKLNKEWSSFRFVFVASHDIPRHERILFTTGSAAGPVWLSDVALNVAAADDIPPSGQSLTSAAIAIPAGENPASAEDWKQFLIDADREYAGTMRLFLRKELGVKACIIDSQVEYGGLAGLQRESKSDYIDHHYYIDHPINAEDLTNWRIVNEPLVNELAAGNLKAPRALACNRIDSMPFSVSEFNHPYPSDYQSDTVPFLASIAAAQDWDSISWFAYNLSKVTMHGWFNMGGDPAKEAFFPAAAAIFRMAELRPIQRKALLTIANQDLLSTGRPEDLWQSLGESANPDVFATRYAVKIDPRAKASSVQVTPSAHPALCAIGLQRTPSGPIYVASGAGALAATGYVGAQSVNRDGVSFAFPAFGNNFASLTLTTVDGKPIAASKRLLLTIVGHAEKEGMGWNADRTSVGTNWGHGPALAEGIPATVALANANVKHVWALDPTGARATEVPVTVSGGIATFTIGSEYRTVWYEIGD